MVDKSKLDRWGGQFRGAVLVTGVPAAFAFLLGTADPLRLGVLGILLLAVLGQVWSATESPSGAFILVGFVFFAAVVSVYLAAFGIIPISW